MPVENQLSDKIMLELFAIIGTAIEASWDGFYGNRSDFFLCKAFEKVRERIPPQTEPPNHLLQRALRKSYLEATLLIINTRIREIQPENWKRLSHSLVKPEMNNPGGLSVWAEKMWKQLSPKNENDKDELLWLINIKNSLAKQRNDVDKTSNPLRISTEYELFMQPRGETVKNRVAAIHKEMEDKLLDELREKGSSNFIGGLNLSSSKEVPPRIVKMVKEGWFPYQHDRIYRSDDEKIYWFDCFCGFFQQKLSGEVGDVFQNRLLTNLIIGKDVPSEYKDGENSEKPFTFDFFKNEIRTFGAKIFERFDNLDFRFDEIDKDLDELKNLILLILGILRNKQPALPNSIPPISGFVGRKDYLDDLRESYQNGTRCFVLHGIGGVGKTSLALEFANEIAGEYATKIFVDMQSLSENPLSWQTAMFEVVRQFEREVPADISEAQMVTHYVQFAQNQPTLIVLDNAANKESVERLMRAKACLIVTSRESFALTDGKSKPIFQMSPADARNLLFKNAGGEKRFDGRADELANLAGYLPMALKPLAALLATDELETVADLIEKYLDKKELLTERVPDYENRTVEASFELSYEVLSAEMKERWRRLSVFPSDFDEGAIAAILEIPADEAKETQKQLRRFSLLEFNSETRRFNLHDLIRAFSRTKPSAEERVKAQLLYSKYYASILQRAAEIQSNDSVNGFVDASKLIDSELKNIVIGLNWAAHFTDQNNFIAELCWDYSNFSAELLILRLHPRTFTAWQQAGLRAARKLENKQYEGSSLGNLGVAYNNLGEYQNSIMCSEQSLTISREINDRKSEGTSLGNLGLAYIGLGELEKAIECSKQSLAIAREINNRESEEANLNNLGNSYYGLGEYKIALGYFEQSLKITRQNSDRPGEAQSLGNLGNTYHALGDYKEAINYQEQSLAIKREISDRHGEGISLGNLGLTYLNLGKKEKACVLWKESVAILEAIESPSTNVFRQLIEANCS